MQQDQSTQILAPSAAGSIIDTVKLYSEFIKQFKNESDRAAVILSTIILDERLEELIKSFLVKSLKEDDELFDSYGAALYDFSGKIDMAYRLGLISKSFRRDLHIIRKIRNEFAHNISGCNFQDMKIQMKIREMTKAMNMDEQITKMGDKKTKEEYPHNYRVKFQSIVSIMIMFLGMGTSNNIQLVEPKNEFMYPFQVKKEKIIEEKNIF
jgi:DNA-binding MltR family transcriptional regulator